MLFLYSSSIQSWSCMLTCLLNFRIKQRRSCDQNSRKGSNNCTVPAFVNFKLKKGSVEFCPEFFLSCFRNERIGKKQSDIKQSVCVCVCVCVCGGGGVLYVHPSLYCLFCKGWKVYRLSWLIEPPRFRHCKRRYYHSYRHTHHTRTHPHTLMW